MASRLCCPNLCGHSIRSPLCQDLGKQRFIVYSFLRGCLLAKRKRRGRPAKTKQHYEELALSKGFTWDKKQVLPANTLQPTTWVCRSDPNHVRHDSYGNFSSQVKGCLDCKRLGWGPRSVSLTETKARRVAHQAVVTKVQRAKLSRKGATRDWIYLSLVCRDEGYLSGLRCYWYGPMNQNSNEDLTEVKKGDRIEILVHPHDYEQLLWFAICPSQA